MPRGRSRPASSPRAARKDAVANRAALLDAAAVVFARSGFRDGNVRDICAKAGVNVGAVNRHFGGKAALYREVVLRAGRALVAQEACPRLEDAPSPADALRQWMRFHLRLVLIRRAADPVAGPLLMREFHEPTEALDDFVRLVVAPVRAELVRIVAALLGTGADDALAARAATLVHGVCVFQASGAPMLARIGQPPPTTEAEIDRLLDVLHPFALAGVQGLRPRGGPSAARRRRAP